MLFNELQRNHLMTAQFRDRRDAGRQLAARLVHYARRPDVIVIALPRGGVPVAAEVAKALDVPLDIFLVRKLGVPGFEELAFGAIASGGIRILNEGIVRELQLSPFTVEWVVAQEEQELERRERAYRGNRQPLQLRGKTVILIDDGIATGATMRAVIRAIRAQEPARIVVAVPVAPPETCSALSAEVDELVCLLAPEDLQAIGIWYRDFSQTSDTEVRETLAQFTRIPSPQPQKE